MKNKIKVWILSFILLYIITFMVLDIIVIINYLIDDGKLESNVIDFIKIISFQ